MFKLLKPAKTISYLFFSSYKISWRNGGGARSSVEECLLREEEATGSNPVESMVEKSRR